MAELNTVCYLAQAKRNNGTFTKGLVVCDSHDNYEDNYDDAQQGLHAYLSAFAYGHEAGTDYVMCEILNHKGTGMRGEFWKKRVPQPEPEPEVTE